MKQFTSMDDVKRYLMHSIEETLLTGMAEVVKDTEASAIQDVVYGAYTPTRYLRRGDKGGLGDRRNMHEHLRIGGDNRTLVVENVTPFKARNDETSGGAPYTFDHDGVGESWNKGLGLDELIEYGDKNPYWYDMPPEGKHGAWEEPRPFTQETIERLKRANLHAQTIKDGLRKRGWDVN